MPLRYRFLISADQILSLFCLCLFAEEMAILNLLELLSALIGAPAATG
jgi:hypothetical protein